MLTTKRPSTPPTSSSKQGPETPKGGDYVADAACVAQGQANDNTEPQLWGNKGPEKQ